MGQPDPIHRLERHQHVVEDLGGTGFLKDATGRYVLEQVGPSVEQFELEHDVI